VTDDEYIKLLVSVAPPVSDEVKAKLRDLFPPVEPKPAPHPVDVRQPRGHQDAA
jgi:hypothetical protein